jgi:hypothetical protein
MGSVPYFPNLAGSDIRNAEFQSSVADSLVDPSYAVPFTNSVDSVADERLVEEFPNGFDGDEVSEQEDDQLSTIPPGGDEDLLGDLDAEQSDTEQEEAQEIEEQRELTVPEVQAGIEQLGEAVEQLGLNDASAAQQLAYDLTVPFGADPGSIDAQALGSTMSKAVLSALQTYQDSNGQLENLGPVPALAAQAFSSDFLRACGMDPRMSGVDSQRLANTMYAGLMNFVDTVAKHGPTASLDQINTPEAAEWFANELYRSVGINEQVDRAKALHLADAGGRYVLSLINKLPKEQEPQPRAQRTRAKRSAGKVPWSSNQDLFDSESVELYKREHGRL